mmetsp:Transcript_33747/g.71941  ORF Transcript_33747/g.71941 Transcript_33747/m.71941 type:complete len:128 (-) Transcript_33747:87-470(-)
MMIFCCINAKVRLFTAKITLKRPPAQIAPTHFDAVITKTDTCSYIEVSSACHAPFPFDNGRYSTVETSMNQTNFYWRIWNGQRGHCGVYTVICSIDERERAVAILLGNQKPGIDLVMRLFLMVSMGS